MTRLSQLFGFFRAFQCWVVIAPWESAVRVRLGKNAIRLGPGPHWRIPFLDRFFVQPVRQQTIADTGQTLTTLDGKILTLSVAITYAIKDLLQLHLSVSAPEHVLLAKAQGHIAHLVSTTKSSELTPKFIDERVTVEMVCTEFGLWDVAVTVTTFAYVRAFRLINYEYRSMNSVNSLEAKV